MRSVGRSKKIINPVLGTTCLRHHHWSAATSAYNVDTHVIIYGSIWGNVHFKDRTIQRSVFLPVQYVRMKLTGGHRHIEGQSISRYDKWYLGNYPYLFPDVLYLAIEEDHPVVYLVAGGGRKLSWETDR